MNSPSIRSGLESLSVGYLVIAFAISFLLAWQFADWLLLIPFFLIAAGPFYIVLGFLYRTSDATVRRGMRNAPYTVFWGGTLALIGILWLVNRQFPDNVPLLIVVFLLWIGGMAFVFALPRIRGSTRAQ
jgi:hypothetical protein